MHRLTANRLIFAGWLLLLSPPQHGTSASAATVLYCPFDSLRGWSVRTVGATTAAIVENSDRSRCVEVASSRGTVLLSRELPLADVRGGSLTVTCSVKSQQIVRGPQLSSTGKLHLAIRTPQGIDHHYARFTGTADWHQEAFTVDVPADAQRVLLNVGLESCFGRAWFDRLIVRTDRRGVHPLDLSHVANADHGQLQLAAFPEGSVKWQNVPFQIIEPAQPQDPDCLRLKGIEHPDWPATTAAPIPVNTSATAIYILHGALAKQGTSDSPCVMWNATFLGGHTEGFSVFQGREIGAVGETEDLQNWRVAWRRPDSSGKPVTFGVTRWTVYNTAPILSLSCQAYHGASPVILAVTVVEEPPPLLQKTIEPESGELDEGGGFQ